MASADKQTNNQFVLTVHVIISTIIFLAGALLTGLCIFAVVNDWPLLEIGLTGSSFFDTVVAGGYVGIAAGVLLMVTCGIGLCATRRGGCGILWKIIYIILILIIALSLVAVAVVAFWFSRNSNPRGIADFFEEQWQDRVVDQSQTICEIQGEFTCQGFYTGDCDTCDTESCALNCTPCIGQDETGLTGCWDKIHDRLDSFYVPIGAVSSVIAALGFLDTILICVM